jgi:hypothetical protein
MASRNPFGTTAQVNEFKEGIHLAIRWDQVRMEGLFER